MPTIEKEIADQINRHLRMLLSSGRTVTVCDQDRIRPLLAAAARTGGGIEIAVDSPLSQEAARERKAPMLSKVRGILLSAALSSRVHEFCCSGVNDEPLTFRIQ
ncbi:hypothetical protein [Hydrogenophaga sp. 2FB]|uniref:hypothetical protein n=1 Tax=Hydrogenophaga sp. 2FB TaxID=2502187 RepID=UPI0010F4CDE6|nr:hypothetical protein [Hydrogenophaga sp. 2FB]